MILDLKLESELLSSLALQEDEGEEVEEEDEEKEEAEEEEEEVAVRTLIALSISPQSLSELFDTNRSHTESTLSPSLKEEPVPSGSPPCISVSVVR